MTMRPEPTQQIYVRKLPGGGHVAIMATAHRTLLGALRYEGTLVVERRGTELRRIGHEPPTVARATASSVSGILHELFPVAQSNNELAVRCIALCRPGTARRDYPFPGATSASML